MRINFGEIDADTMLLSSLENVDSIMMNKVYSLAAIKEMLPDNSKISRQMEMLIVNYLCESRFSGAFALSDSVASSKTYRKTVEGLEKRYDEILEKDTLDEIYRLSAPDSYYIQDSTLRDEMMGFGLTDRNKKANFSLLALQFSDTYVTGMNSSMASYGDGNNLIITNPKDQKHFLDNLKRAVSGKKLKNYGSVMESPIKR